MIDLHCHILPDMDDGPSSIEESFSMAERAFEDGIRTIVATPHTLDGVYENPPDKVHKAIRDFRTALQEKGIELQIFPGSDTHLCSHLTDKIRNKEVCTINDSGRYLLLELPFQNIPEGAKGEIFSMKLEGITPIITHPERNLAIQQDMTLLFNLVSMGALVQITAMSVTGYFGQVVQDCARTLLERRLVHVIASDAHSPDDRPPLLSEGVEEAAEILGDFNEAKRMVTSVPKAILAGEKVEITEP